MPIDIVFFDRKGELIAIVSNKAWVLYQHSQPLLDTYDWWKEYSINKFPVKQLIQLVGSTSSFSRKGKRFPPTVVDVLNNSLSTQSSFIKNAIKGAWVFVDPLSKRKVYTWDDTVYVRIPKIGVRAV